MGLVVIGLLDTDCDPDGIDIAIPGNDDALRSVRLLIESLVKSVEEGAASHRDRLASMGVTERVGEETAASDEPRPTRGRTLPRRAAEASAPPGAEDPAGASEGDAEGVPAVPSV
jgi:small subunit ribosomal protein S2